MYQKLTNLLGLPPWMKYVLELLVIVLLFGFLVLLNWALGLQKDLRGPTALRPIWLGLIGVLVYFAVRLFFFILAQLPTARAEFPDIQLALNETLETLAEAGISFRDAPLFLVLGLDSDSEQEFIQSPLVGQRVRITSRRFPIHVYGDEQALWLTLPGISALVQQRESPPAPSSGSSGVESAISNVAGIDLANLPAEGGDEAQFATIGAAGFPGLLSAVRKVTSPVPRRQVRLSSQERELARRRFQYFMQLLREARGTVCTYNGLLVTIPFEWLLSVEGSRLADAAGLDMSVLQKFGGVKCLTLTVFTGIEKSKEFTAYVERLDRSELERRCGCGFPPLTAYSADDGPNLHAWLTNYFERQIYELYQRNLQDPENGILFRFLAQFRTWKLNFSRLMQSVFTTEGEPMYFGGVYFASPGKVGSAVRPFWDGVLAKLRREHDEVVGWNDQAVNADRRAQNITYLAMSLIAALTVIDAVLIVLILL